MPILILCQDSANAAELRKKHLQAHLDYITSILELLAVAGPTKQGEQPFEAEQFSETTDGSCFIYATDDPFVAQGLFEQDPYASAGVYQSSQVLKFTAAAGTWIGGTTW